MKQQTKLLLNAIILMTILSGTAFARMPQIGDYVTIELGTKEKPFTIEGTIKDIGNDLICLYSTYAVTDGTTTIWDNTNPRDICVGTGSIVFLQWHD